MMTQKLKRLTGERWQLKTTISTDAFHFYDTQSAQREAIQSAIEQAGVGSKVKVQRVREVNSLYRYCFEVCSKKTIVLDADASKHAQDAVDEMLYVKKILAEMSEKERKIKYSLP